MVFSLSVVALWMINVRFPTVKEGLVHLRTTVKIQMPISSTWKWEQKTDLATLTLNFHHYNHDLVWRKIGMASVSPIAILSFRRFR